MNTRREVFFLESQKGRRFCLATHPDQRPRGGLLYLHPFAEEMNKARRMAALAASAFAERGWTVIQIDLFGCGDSEGDFADACWQDWLDDVTLGWERLKLECEGPLALWSLRAGSLLAADWLPRQTEHVPLLMWQPVTNGKQHLAQFLRLKAASEMLAESDAKEVMRCLRRALEVGESVEVAGYGLSAGLASGLNASTLNLCRATCGSVSAFEVTRSEQPQVSPALEMMARKWQESDIAVSTGAVAGSAFWQTQEIETVPELITVSLRALERFIS